MKEKVREFVKGLFEASMVSSGLIILDEITSYITGRPLTPYFLSSNIVLGSGVVSGYKLKKNNFDGFRGSFVWLASSLFPYLVKEAPTKNLLSFETISNVLVNVVEYALVSSLFYFATRKD
ncbi:MAG: hypothetical protein QXL86_01170 [Candidatus Aenigmatarchaeota archaeon]